MAEQNTASDGGPDTELMSRFSKIDQAIARDIERRQRGRRVYWLLLAIAVAIGVAALLFGPGKPTQVARAVVDDPQLRKKLADEPALAQAVINAPAVRQQLTETAQDAAVEAAGSEAFVTTLAGSSIFSDRVGSAALQAFEADPELRQRLGTLTGDSYTLRADLRKLAGDVASLRDAVDALSETPGEDRSVDARLDAIARRQAEIVTAVERQVEQGIATSARIDALAEAVAGLQQPRGLDPERAAGAEPLASLSYLLRENADTPLAGVGLTISLGRRKGATIENVRVTDGAGRVFPGAGASGTAVDLGDEFEFSDSSGSRYTAVFTYAQNRILWRDYVGLDLYRLTD